MSNTVITNYTDLNGPSTKADSSVVVIVNKDGSLSVDEKLLGAFMSNDGSQGTGISVVRVGHDGRPDDATDSDTEDDSVPHVTLSVDSYYDEPNSIVKYDSGAEMLQSLRLETRENSLLGFQNDHCYTPHITSNEILPPNSANFPGYDEPILEIKPQKPPKPPIPVSKKITILEQHVIPKGKKILINPSEALVLSQGSDVLNKLNKSTISKSKQICDQESTYESNNESKDLNKSNDETDDTTSVSSSGESAPDRDSDSDYKDTQEKTVLSKSKQKLKSRPRILKGAHPSKIKERSDSKLGVRGRNSKNLIKKEIKEKLLNRGTNVLEKKQTEIKHKEEEFHVLSGISLNTTSEQKQLQKVSKKERKPPAHMTALLSDMSSLFSTPDVIRRVSTDNKVQVKPEKNIPGNKKVGDTSKSLENQDEKDKAIENKDKVRDKSLPLQKINLRVKDKITTLDKVSKSFEPIPQLDEASLAQIFQDTAAVSSVTKGNITSNPLKDSYTPSNTINSPSLAGPLSPTLDLLGALQPEEEDLTEDLLMHVAQLVESSENLQEVIDKQVLGKVDTHSVKTNIQAHFQQTQSENNIYSQNTPKSAKSVGPRKDPIEIVRKDGRVITLPPIEAPATRASKRKSQLVSSQAESPMEQYTNIPVSRTPEPQLQQVSRHYVNKKLLNKKQEPPVAAASSSKLPIESEESWNSEDDPDRLWCICQQPHNNRFMICCDRCEDWFHGKCVNITKAMGQQMEQQGIEWTCPNCIKKTQTPKANIKSASLLRKQDNEENKFTLRRKSGEMKNVGHKTSCIVCKKEARANSIYCSDACILKYAHDSLGSQTSPNKADDDSGKTLHKQNDSKVIVFERTTGRCLDGPNAPTAENLKAWLQKNPTFEVVRPGTLSVLKPGVNVKKGNPTQKIQTILNFEKLPKKSFNSPDNVTRSQSKVDSKELKSPSLLKDDGLKRTITKTPATPKQNVESPKSGTPKTPTEIKRPARSMFLKQQSTEKPTSPTIASTPKKKEKEVESRRKSSSSEPIRDNVRKSLQEQMMIRMSENEGPKFTEEEVQTFATETEAELHELFRDVGMKYKAKYRSLMFNIKDRKNLSLWQKICDRDITPKQLVRLSPEELASQELAQWRDKEAKHQLELIKKSELDLLAASKTYVLKTHKGEEVMETKKSVSTELDPNVPVEDVVTALNDSTATEETPSSETSKNSLQDPERKSSDRDRRSSRRRDKDDRSSTRSKKNNKRSKRDPMEYRSTRKSSRSKQRDEKTSHKVEKKQSRARSSSKDRSRPSDSQSSESLKRKSQSQERLSRRSHSRGKSKRRSKSRELSRTRSRSRARSLRRSTSRGNSKQRPSARETRSKLRSRSKHRTQSSETAKPRSHSQEHDKIEKKQEEPVERPKSAMMKEIHPEYDPHEPMITSAVSEEDLRKSRDDVYEEGYGEEITSEASKTAPDCTEASKPDYNPNNKKLTMNTSSRTTRSSSKGKEPESDQEPSSTVDMSAVTVWNGCINMVDVARFYVAAHEVSGHGADLEEDLSAELDIVGRINPDTVWDYINKMKRTGNKDIVILRLSAANDEEKMQYIALYSYLSSRNRLGVVKVANTTTVKDFYILPLPANSAIPQVLLPLEGPGLDEARTHLLIAIVIRQRKKRSAPTIPKDTVPAKVARESRNRSYTPPVAKTYTPPASPKRRAPLPMPYTSPALSTSVKDKIAATLACADDEEAYSPGSASSGGSAAGEGGAGAVTGAGGADALRCKMEELNRQIEEQKQQIRKMTQADSSVGEDEAYSPSRPMTPPSVVPLADIALPSNLQEILATIKQRTEAGAAAPVTVAVPVPVPVPVAIPVQVVAPPLADVDMRTAYPPANLPLPPDQQ